MTSTMQKLSSWRYIHLLELIDYIEKKFLKPDGITIDDVLLEFETFYSEYYEKPETKES